MPRLLTGNRGLPRARTLIHRYLCHLGSAAGTAVGLQDLFPETQRFRRDLHKLILSYELDRLLQVQGLERYQAYGIISRRSAHVREFFLANHIHIEIHVARILSDNHALVHISSRSDKQLSTLLQIVKSISRRYTRTVRYQGAGDAMRNLTLIFNVSVKQ